MFVPSLSWQTELSSSFPMKDRLSLRERKKVKKEKKGGKKVKKEKKGGKKVEKGGMFFRTW